jgi:putative FmdB family regulatory protein
MPTYEYRCKDCNQKFEIFLSYQEYENSPVACPACGGSNPERIIRPVRISRTEKTRLDSLTDPNLLDGMDDDPQTLGKMMRESPEEIERDLPDLGGDEGIPGPGLNM